MLISDGLDYLELTVTHRGPPGAQDAGDTAFGVRVRVHSMDTVFTGETTCYVRLGALVEFAQQLKILEERRQGSAVLDSANPGELVLDIRSVDRMGHIAAVGQVGHWCCWSEREPQWSAIGFSIGVSDLPKLLREFSALADESSDVSEA